MTDTEELINEYIETRLAYDTAHAISVEADKVFKGAKKRLVDGMIEAKDEGKKKSYGLGFYLSNQFSIACNKENEDDVKDWLEERYGDLEEFCAQKVQKSTVEERLKSDIEGEQLNEFDVPDFMNLKTRPDVSCTGWKKYSLEQRKPA